MRANKGAAGVDGLDIDQTSRLLAATWPVIREQLLSGTYPASAGTAGSDPEARWRRARAGQPDGDGSVDPAIQQALLQVLQAVVDPTFGEHSYGFRPGRRAQDAVLAAQAHVQSGRQIVVDVDLEKFFDRVNHDILIDRLRTRIDDAGVIRLVRAYLNSGILVGGLVQDRYQGTPQGGPLSPLLPSVLLDEVDKELERRGRCFVRYADDANVCVRSRRPGERVMALLGRLYGQLRLTVNAVKSAVVPVAGRKFLGYSIWFAREHEVKRRVADKPLAAFTQRVRWLDGLRPYLLGWKAYFGLAQTPGIWQELDQGLRHRLRAIQLKQWRRGPTIYRKLRALGARLSVARKVAANSRRWWRNSAMALNNVLTIAWFDRLGLPQLS